MTGRPFVALALLVALAACSPEAAPYRNPIDRFLVDYGRFAGFNYWACSRSDFDGEWEIMSSLPSEQCYRFNPPQRMRGVWMPGLETSEFIPDATSAPAVFDMTDEGAIWLEADWQELEDRLPEPVETDYEAPTAAYVIEFVGRRATYPGVYGGGGFFGRHLVILDDLISARAIPPTPAMDRRVVRRILLRWSAEATRCQAEKAEAASRFTAPLLPRFLRAVRPHPARPVEQPLDHCTPIGKTEPPRRWWMKPIEAILRPPRSRSPSSPPLG